MKELVEKVAELYAAFEKDAKAQLENGNKAAGTRARKDVYKRQHTGTPAVFVRFSGCNLKCSFCDTQHEEGVWMSDEEILAEVGNHNHAV